MQNQIDPDQFEFMGMGEANTNPILLPPQQPMAPQSQQDLGHLVFPQDPSNTARGSLMPYIGQVGPDGKIIKGTGQWALPSMVRDTINDLALTAMAPGMAAQGRLATSDLPAVANRMGMTLAAGGIGASTLAEPELDANVLGSFRGFHGTPHTFEPVDHNPFGEFSDEKIGSGEGAQAFGYGHYVAGNPKTATQYQQSLAGDLPAKFNGQAWTPSSKVETDARNLLSSSGWDLDEAKQITAGGLKNMQDLKANPEGMSDFLRANPDMVDKGISDRSDLLDWLNQHGSKVEGPKGNMYHVEVRPEEHELLDWDQPLSQQSPHVLGKLSDVLPNIQAMSTAPDKDLLGRSVYHNLSNLVGGPENASRYLNGKGIPGIKYLDQFSRGRPPEDQTRNYTIFHPSNLKIVGRNGEELAAQPVEHDPFTHTATAVEHDPFGAQPE